MREQVPRGGVCGPILCAIIAVLLLVGYVNSVRNRPYDRTYAGEMAVKPIAVLSVDEWYATWERNSMDAERMFKDQVVELHGSVRHV